MFVLTTFVDTIRVEPSMLSESSIKACEIEMDKKYPNKVVMDIGLVICRYGEILKISEGICVAGDGGAHHEVIFKLLIFRPTVEEVCLGTIKKSTRDGITVSLGGFFDDIFIPAYWMLRPSYYEKSSGLWIWTPSYDDDDDENNDNDGIKVEADGDNQQEQESKEEGGEEANRFEMEIGAEIRFKVKSINFTRVTNTAKGMQATTTTTSQSFKSNNTPSAAAGAGATTTRERTFSTDSAGSKDSKDGGGNPSSSATTAGAGTSTTKAAPPPAASAAQRKRSASIGDLSDPDNLPASMHIVASICEDGLGLTSWWGQSGEEEEEEEEE